MKSLPVSSHHGICFSDPHQHSTYILLELTAAPFTICGCLWPSWPPPQLEHSGCRGGVSRGRKESRERSQRLIWPLDNFSLAFLVLRSLSQVLNPGLPWKPTQETREGQGCAPNISQTGGAALCLAPDPAGLLSPIVCWLLVLHLALLGLDDMVAFLFSVPYNELLT